MMMSLSTARWCIRVMKQRSKLGHFWPVHRSLRASTLAQAVLRFGQRLDLGAVAELGGLLPFADDLEIGDLFQAGEHRLLLGVVDLLAAGVVVAALHVADLQGPREMLLQERDVLEEELLLQVLGAGGDHDALAGEQRGDQVGERLAGAGAGLDDQVALIGERRFHGLRHFHLAGAELVVRMPLGERAVPREELARAGGSGLGGHRDALILTGVRLQHLFQFLPQFGREPGVFAAGRDRDLDAAALYSAPAR